MINAVYFDGDQTLWDFQQVMGIALAATLEHLQAARPGPLSSALSVSDLRDDRDDIAREWEGREYNLARLRRLAFERTLGRLHGDNPVDKQADDLLATELTAAYFEHRDRDPALFPDTVEALMALQPDYRLGLLSNGSRLPKKVGLDGYFEAIVFAQDHQVNKPEAEIFTIAQRLMKVPASECVLIGDHPLNDVVGAKRSGWRAIWINREKATYQPPAGYDEQPDAIITSLLELPEVLKHL